jgi:2-dehydro-3-deoxyphosphogluconate aldolase/(4S)-4-hydroxy-2-oxoglutarate aldolase
MHQSVNEQLAAFGVIPVVTIEDAKNAVPLAEALLAGGLACAEITFRTGAARDSIAAIGRHLPEVFLMAGTVLTVEQASQAVAAGAAGIVTPGFDEAVVGWCSSSSVPVFPGVTTPTEINMALKFGLETLKFFPAEAYGGLKTLKALGGPYPNIRFIPTGGINPGNLADYLGHPSVIACGGSWLVKKALIAAGDFDEITRLTREAVGIVQASRGN